MVYPNSRSLAKLRKFSICSNALQDKAYTADYTLYDFLPGFRLLLDKLDHTARKKSPNDPNITHREVAELSEGGMHNIIHQPR